MLRRSRIARWMIVPGVLALTAGLIAPVADAGTVPKKRVQANYFRFCSYRKDMCTTADEGHRTRVAKGTRVVWIYKDTFCDASAYCPGHNVKVGQHPRSATVKTEGARIFAMTFNTVGRYYYRCTHHVTQGMTGKVVVYSP